MMNSRETIIESIDIEPGVVIDRDGEKIISWPENAARKVLTTCKYCEGSGRDIQWESNPRRQIDPTFIDPCEVCDGKGKNLEWVCDYPKISMSNYSVETVIAPLLGVEFDYAHFFPREELPNIRRRLIRIKNGDTSDFARPASDEQAVVVDRSGAIPRIGRGARMIDFGISDRQIDALIDRLLEIIDWAQKNGCGLRWA